MKTNQPTISREENIQILNEAGDEMHALAAALKDLRENAAGTDELRSQISNKLQTAIDRFGSAAVIEFNYSRPKEEAA
jgi:hypothetical protein